MKKIRFLALVLVVAALMTGCGSDGSTSETGASDNNISQTEPPTSETQPTETDAPAEFVTLFSKNGKNDFTIIEGKHNNANGLNLFASALMQKIGHNIKIRESSKMRLVATIADKDIKNYNSVGFEVVAVYGENVKSTSFTSKTVYTSIGANTATGDTTISAESLIGADGYIFAMIIGNLPADTPVTLQVKTFYTDINDTQTDGSTTVFTVSQMPSGTVSGGK